MHQKLVQDYFFILVNNPKQTLQARNSSKNKVYWKRIMKNLEKAFLYFLFWIQSPSMETILFKTKRTWN